MAGLTTEQLKQKYTPTQASTPVPPTQASGGLSTEQLKQRYSVGAPSTTPEQSEGDGLLKGLVKPATTMLARPFQAVAQLAGATAEDVDKFSEEKLGGFVAPVPRNLGDVKKDVGRGIQTVALGLPGLASGGAAFGVGMSLEEGNDLFSSQTAFDAVLGAGGAKLAGLVGKPLISGAGKVVGKITPQVLKDVAKRGGTAVQEFAATHKIMPQGASDLISKGAVTAERVADAPFKAAKKPFVRTPEQELLHVEKDLAKVSDKYVDLRKLDNFSKDGGKASRKRIVKSDVLVGAGDEEGIIRTKQDGGAVSQYKKIYIDDAEDVVHKNFVRTGEKLDAGDIERRLLKEIQSGRLAGKDKVSAFSNAKKDMEGFRLNADANDRIAIADTHMDKINVANKINFQTEPEKAAYRKMVARVLKEAIEDASSFNVKEVNKELAKYYGDIEFLRKLDGKRVQGGRLGKYFARITGNVAGGAVGGAVGGFTGSAAGTVIGGEIASKIQGKLLSKTFGKGSGLATPRSSIIRKATDLGNSPRLALPAPEKGAPRSEKTIGRVTQLPKRSQSTIDATERANPKIKAPQSLRANKVQDITSPTKKPSNISKTIRPSTKSASGQLEKKLKNTVAFHKKMLAEAEKVKANERNDITSFRKRKNTENVTFEKKNLKKATDNLKKFLKQK